MPDFIVELNQQCPNLTVDISVDISVALTQYLLDREIDLAILLGPISESSIDNISLPKMPFVWYTGAMHDPKKETLRSRPVATYARKTRPYRELKNLLFEKTGPDIRLFPSYSLSTCFRLVETGLCVAALPKALGRIYAEAGKIQEFDPGWIPSSLEFTVSYLADPKNHLIETAALIAQETAERNI